MDLRTAELLEHLGFKEVATVTKDATSIWLLSDATTRQFGVVIDEVRRDWDSLSRWRSWLRSRKMLKKLVLKLR